MDRGALAWSLAGLALATAVLSALAVGRFPIPPGALPDLILGRGDPVALTVLPTTTPCSRHPATADRCARLVAQSLSPSRSRVTPPVAGLGYLSC